MKFFLNGLFLFILVVIVVMLVLVTFSIISNAAVAAAILGILLSILFVTAGYFSFIFAMKFRQKKFNKIVGISILSRLVLMTLSIVSILVFLSVDKAAFLIGLFVSYFGVQILEVVSFNKINTGEV